MNVTRKLITSGVKAESNPFQIEIPIDMSMNKALISNALPILVDIAFMLIALWTVICCAKILKNLFKHLHY